MQTTSVAIVETREEASPLTQEVVAPAPVDVEQQQASADEAVPRPITSAATYQPTFGTNPGMWPFGIRSTGV
jgi:hypothetical protein